ncbi:MAG: DUF5103 domain-containing protein [Prevotellaceae bacterium]|nr:DUF5103 domain-containing protein [Prevotella sp.]MDD7258151.1 DUF5103 domain-containing protein [Prevotellaceae bacterium]MDY6130994.1 DUF5103 domain-containing protein [Prevotella sp.]
MKKPVAFLFILMACLSARGQRNEIHAQGIATLQVVAGNRWLDMPVVWLNGPEAIHISFDDLTHEYKRYTYKIEHCEADWTVSEDLFASDYVDGFPDENTIDRVEQSYNTTVLYTHYSLSIPNEKCRIKMSGNYKLTVSDANNANRKVLTACFMVCEQTASLQMNVTTNTDIDVNKAHQQVSMNLNYGNLIVNAPQEQIKTVVLQNGCWNSARINAAPQYYTPQGLSWQHQRDFIFPAGNEYRKFETLDTDHPTMGIDRMAWDGEHYHAYPFVNEPRYNYVYDKDANGAFYVRNSDNIDNDIASDYLLVHYVLKCPQPVNGEVYINGTWTNGRFLQEYKMEYNEETKAYEAVVMQKQGYYSYRYVLMLPDGTINTMPTEGDFYQTENKYQALVYFKGSGERTDRLVGFQETR